MEFSMTKKFYINCPYDEKDLAKTLGAKWDLEAKKWYVPDGIKRETFRRWWPENTRQKPDLKVVK